MFFVFLFVIIKNVNDKLSKKIKKKKKFFSRSCVLDFANFKSVLEYFYKN